VADWLSSVSYGPIPGLLTELRAAWPPRAAAETSGYTTTDLGAAEPIAVLGLTDRLALAIAARPEGSFAAVPVVRDDPWRQAIAGDGLSAFVAGLPLASERSIGTDQTNESIVVGERVIVKWFRIVGPQPSRAPIVAAHLESIGFRETPRPLGTVDWLAPTGEALTLAQGDAYLPGARDGWDWCVERLERHVAHESAPCRADCDPWIGGRLGLLVARLHAALRQPSAVIAEPAGVGDGSDVRRWHAAAISTLDEALRLSEADPSGRELLAAVGPGMRADIDRLVACESIAIQPVHGDLHVGQVLEWPGGLAVIDFDGNPALAAAANELRQPAERDIAQMASSLDHVGRIVDERTAGGRHQIVEEWVARTRGEFVAELKADRALLAAFEVEQECRELIYAARFLPRWRYAPLATLRARYRG
jgi:maltokinase